MTNEKKYYGVSRCYNGNFIFYKNSLDCINSARLKEMKSIAVFYEPKSKLDLINEIEFMN